MQYIGDIEITGSIIPNVNGTSEYKRLIPERVTTVTETELSSGLSTPHGGMIVYNSDTAMVKVWTGSTFSTIGGDAAELEGKLATLINSFGSILTADGTFNQSALQFLNNIDTSSANDVFDVLQAFNAAIGPLQDPIDSSNLTDFAITDPKRGQFITFSDVTQKWANADLVLQNVSDVTVSATELDYCEGLTQNVQQFISASQITIDYLNTVVGTLTARLESFNPIEQEFVDETRVIISHNKNRRYPAVVVVDGSGQLIIPSEVTYTDENTLSVTFDVSTTGVISVT